MKPHRILLLVAMAITLCSCTSGGDDNEEYISHVTPRMRIPDFETQTPSHDGTISSQDIIRPGTGQRTLLVLFASYCPDCKVAMQFLKANIWPTMSGEPEKYKFVAISRREDLGTVMQYWADNQYDMPYYLDPTGAVYDKFATGIIPRIYIVNDQGVVEHMWIEQINVSGEEMLRLLAGEDQPQP